MVKGMKYNDIEKALLAAGCKWRQGKGSHVIWYCPCGKHMVAINHHQMVSPGVIGDATKKLSCLPEGLLQ